MYIDTYISSDDLELLTKFTEQFRNSIPVQKGREAANEIDLGDGMIVPAQEQIGDPEMFYTCVRSNFPIQLPVGISKVDAKLGAQLVGVWA